MSLWYSDSAERSVLGGNTKYKAVSTAFFFSVFPPSPRRFIWHRSTRLLFSSELGSLLAHVMFFCAYSRLLKSWLCHAILFWMSFCGCHCTWLAFFPTHISLWVGIKSLLPTGPNYCPNKGWACGRKCNLGFFSIAMLQASCHPRATLCPFHVCTTPTLAYLQFWVHMVDCKSYHCNNILDDYLCLWQVTFLTMYNILWNQIDLY